ncbi:hypothetical protein K469DRAFT_666565 [Zopfia rhizophila CBS 207.26]|uniref:FUN14-domain-containing protein n=1 Tax=Zopfia rhizophila CBS 207.26 TaxID=1314779 RepID=A0A6A6DYF3_9PEZI|nr:hypothetical protein K469DRAFT_666565 [Zopfia rhizophila CBS 207.26]
MSILPGLRRTLLLSTPFLASAPLLLRQCNRPLLCDSSDPLTKITSDLKYKYIQEAQRPVSTSSGRLNPSTIRQISLGSILGVLGGLGVSVFSRPLAVLLGLGIFFVQEKKKLTEVTQFLESRGIHVIPYSYLQQRFHSTNIRSLVQDNIAFKVSFGITFALAGFAEFKPLD